MALEPEPQEAEIAPPTRRQAPFGTWASPISAESLAAGAVGVSDLRAVAGRLFWLENRPEQGGRMAAVIGDEEGWREITQETFNVRTRVHEYGGAAYVVVGDTLYFSNFSDQRLYAQTADGAPVPLTPKGFRYADCVAGPHGGLIGVREDHSDPADVKNAIVALDARPDDAGRVLFGDSDFVAYPRVSPDGRRLAWMAWDHPNMPWDDTRLYVADLGSEGLKAQAVIAGGGAESVMEPQWDEDGSLLFLSDRSGFWNLYVYDGSTTQPVFPAHAEFAGPLWALGQANYALLGGGRIAAACADAQGDHLLVIDRKTGVGATIPLPFTVLGGLQRLTDRRIALIAASGSKGGAVMSVDVVTGAFVEIRRPSPASLDAGFISHAQAVSFPGPDGREVHALFYPPTSGDFVAPEGSKPPLIVQVHGGPTGQASASLSLSNQFWTTRGFALLDVDYSGSSGYGRAYRQRLNGQWGIIDVEDVAAAVEHLVASGRVDPQRVAIHGGSAGGFTVLAALGRSDVFKAGASFYGVADLEALARDTHKFESRYLDRLIGPYPEAKATYQSRSPINHLASLRAPLIIFQGSADPIVPPNQAHLILEALRRRGQPVAYLEFPDEGHGFRRAENVIAAKKAELYFYGRVFGFAPADALPEIPIENLA